MIYLKYILWVMTAATVVSCTEVFDYSPYSLNFSESEKNQNAKNAIELAENLSAILETDTLTIAFFSDTHRFYDSWNKAVVSINDMTDIDFLIHAGDFTDFGLPRQYQWGLEIMQQLKIPFFVTIGNHDLVAAGNEAFELMFGSLNYSFMAGDTKVILMNSNSLEYNFNGNVPNNDFLRQEVLSTKYNNLVVVIHTPLYDNDFDQNLKNDFLEIIHANNKPTILLHGHHHHFEEYFLENCRVPMVNVFGIEHNQYTVLKIVNNEFTISNREF